MRSWGGGLALTLLLSTTHLAAAEGPEDWQTPAETSGYATTPRYDETMAYLRRIAAAAPGQVRIETFGKSGDGRDLVIAVASRDGVFDPDAVHRAGRPIVLIQNAIHAGEIDGKDACLALLRDMVVTKTQARLLDRAVVVIIPIYNADGHERFGPNNRINQNGPREAGWRTTAINLNLNRDYMKADAPETRAFLRLWNRWLPDYFVDDHVTDGADYQYEITFACDWGPDLPPETAAWQREIARQIEDSVSRTGHLAGPFIGLKDAADPRKGLGLWPSIPRYSTGYAIVQSRPGMLVEMHMLKSYRARVTGNYEILRTLLEIVNRDAEQLVRFNREADAATVAAGKRAPREPFPLAIEADGRTEPWVYRGIQSETSQSDVSGAARIRFHPGAPIEVTIPRDSGWRVSKTVVPPAAYIVPAAWTSVLDVLATQGVKTLRTSQAWEGPVGTYRCDAPRWNLRPFEGRQVLFSPGEGTPQSDAALGDCRVVNETMAFPAGSVVVPLDQRGAKLAIHFLEPQGPDSAMAWGFFNAIFEQKEFGEDYVLEPLARRMLAEDPKLSAEFQAKIASDPKFAADPVARLNFFFQHSPWRDPRQGLYPIGRLGSLDGIPISK